MIDVDANSLAGPDYGGGHAATMAALAENPITCGLCVTVFTAPRVDPYLSTDEPPYQQLFGTTSSIFATPALAMVPAGQTSGTAHGLICQDSAPPISVVQSLHEPDDCHGGTAVNLDDYAALYGYLTGPAVNLTAGCECLDLQADGSVDLSDCGLLQSVWTQAYLTGRSSRLRCAKVWPRPRAPLRRHD